MSFLSQMARLFSLWPGDLVYHLVVLFAIEAMLGLAISHGRRRAWPRSTQRVMQAGLGLTCGRILLMLAALLTRQAGFPAAAILPLLERFIDVAGLGLLAWAFVPLGGQTRRAGYVLGLANPIAALVMYALQAPRWYTSAGLGAAFNGSLQDVFWSAWGWALAGVAVAGVLTGWRRDDQVTGGEWGYTLIAFAFVSTGYLLHLLFPDQQLSVASWPRLAFLVAYPLFVAALYQQTLRPPAGLPQHAGNSSAVPLAWPVWDALQAVIASAHQANQADALQKAAAAIAASLNVRAVAVGLPGNSPDVVELVAAHCSGQPLTPGGIFPLEAQPAIKGAIARKQGLPIGAQSGEAPALVALLGRQPLGPLWIEPIIYGRQALGVLIAGKAKDGAGWLPAEIQAIHAHAARLGGALDAARRLGDAIRRNQDMSRQLASLESQSSQSKTEAEARLSVARAELEQVKSELYAARQQIAQYRKQVDDLAALVQLQESIVQRAQGRDESA